MRVDPSGDQLRTAPRMKTCSTWQLNGPDQNALTDRSVPMAVSGDGIQYVQIDDEGPIWVGTSMRPYSATSGEGGQVQHVSVAPESSSSRRTSFSKGIHSSPTATRSTSRKAPCGPAPIPTFPSSSKAVQRNEILGRGRDDGIRFTSCLCTGSSTNPSSAASSWWPCCCRRLT